MTYIQPAKHVFFDADGSVLQNGSVYIGQPGQDPRTNQKTVTFTDAGGFQFTASQPLSVINGRISYNGRPIVAEVDGEHSILVLNANGTQIDYTPSVVPPATSGGVTTDGIRYGLTLGAVKALDVAVGDVVRSVGSLTATDSLGADWLVTTATGSPGDDVDLIDFDNGLQGRRIMNQIYRGAKQVWSGSSTSVSVNTLSDTTPGIYFVSTSVFIFPVEFSFISRTDLSVSPAIMGTSMPIASDLGGGHYEVGAMVCSLTIDRVIKVTKRSLDIYHSGPTFNYVEFDSTITAIYKV